MTPFRVPTPSWPAQLADGRTAALHDLVMTVEGDALVARAAKVIPGDAGDPDKAGVLLRWPLAGVIVEPVEQGRACLTSPEAPEAQLMVDLASLAAYTTLLQPDAVRPSRRWRTIVLYAAGALAAAALVYGSLDRVAGAVARRIPRSYEAQLGQGLTVLLERQYCETPDARAAMTVLARRLALSDDEPVQQLHIMDTPTVNAFTLPGGVVIATRGLIEQATIADELAGVLAHELEHVRRRHVMIQVVRGAVLTALWQATVGDYSGLMVVDPKTALDVANLRFSRAAEREADEGAVRRLDNAGISRRGLRIFFERMRAKTDVVPAWLSNHPATSERLAAFADEPGAVPRTPALSPNEWTTIKNGCHPPPP